MMSKLDRMRIAKPCPVSWNEMSGDDKVRHCSKCNLRVYNLTAMTRAEAEQLIATRDGRLCLRYYRRADGRIMTSDCPVGVRRVRGRRALITGSLLAFLINIIMGEAGATQGIVAQPQAEGYEMGKMPIQNYTTGVLAPSKPAAPPALGE
jgi:hypothetical protein